MQDFFRLETKEGPTRLFLRGSWRLKNLVEIISSAQSLKTGNSFALAIDGRELEAIDTSGAMVLFRSLSAWGIDPEKAQFVNFRPEHLSIVSLTQQKIASPAYIGQYLALGFVEGIGMNTIALCRTIQSLLLFFGEITVEMFRALLEPRLLRFKEMVVQLEQTCVNALPIVGLVTFLIGVVLAYLFGVQMEKYGANILIIDAVSISMCREISPILVAIIVAGRSGSAFTAQIGTMKINEEVDALKTLGLSPFRVLILPRMFALIVAMPILTFVGDVVGIIGGMMIADLRLDITVATFLTRLRIVLLLRHVLVGMFKAPFFAFVIAAIGCRMGLVVENNARSVGLNTTATVVRSLVVVILLNAAFAVIFSELGI